MNLLNSRWLGVPYRPQPDDRSFCHRAEARQDDDLVVKAAVLDDRESARFFGVPLARRGIQPVWLEISNHGKQPYRLRLASLDPNYYPPLEAAFVNHFRIGVRFTPKTWNLTTHKIDPDVDDARDYVLDDLMEAGRVSQVAYVPGAVAADQAAPRHNLTGDPYFTDGLRAVAIFSEARTNPSFLDWG